MASAPAFLHNGRLALASGPALVLLADFGSTVLLSAGALALIACYLLEALGQAGASFTTLWLCVGVGAACYGASAFFVFGASIRALGLATLSTSLILLIGLWGTLQFRPFARHQRSLAAFCEEALFALLPLPGAAIPTWGFTALVGARDSPWVLLTALAAQYALLSGDVRPSFPCSGGRRAGKWRACHHWHSGRRGRKACERHCRGGRRGASTSCAPGPRCGA